MNFFLPVSIVSVDGKQHLNVVVFCALVGFSLLKKYLTFRRGKKKQEYLESQKLQELGEPQESSFLPKNSGEECAGALS